MQGRAYGPPLPLCSHCLCLVLGHMRWALISPEQQTGQQQSSCDHCAVNYLYWSRSIPDLDLIRRQPNEIQSLAISRLRLLLEACDHSEPIQVATSGRRNLQFVTRLQELARAADALGLSASPCQNGPAGVQVAADNTGAPQLAPSPT